MSETNAVKINKEIDLIVVTFATERCKRIWQAAPIEDVDPLQLSVCLNSLLKAVCSGNRWIKVDIYS